MLTEEQLPISIDTAVEILGHIFAKTSMRHAVAEGEERIRLQSELDQLKKEEDMLYGVGCSDEERLSLYQKITHTYAPLVKDDYSRGSANI